MKEYTVEIGGLEHTLQLSDEDAKRMNAKAVSVKEAAQPANKARDAKSKG